MRWGETTAPAVVVAGAELALARHPDSKFLLFGQTSRWRRCWRSIRRCKAASRLVHTDIAVRMDDKPSQALRHGRWKSSMWLAIDAVKKGEADVAVSAGNTGALMAMAKFACARWPGIERPAIAALWPTLRGEASCSTSAPRSAPMPSIWSTSPSWAPPWRASCSDIERPTVGLLNIGVEEVKGLEEVREAGPDPAREPICPHLDYVGFVEGDDIGKGNVDVVVTEGFAGNIALKTAEGTARQIGGYLRAAMGRTLAGAARLSVRARAPSTRCATRWTRARSNGGVFLGLNGIVIKSHGGTDAEGFAAPSTSATRWCATSCSAKITARRSDRMRRRATPRHGAIGSRLVTSLRSVVLGCGSYLPSRVLTNADLARMVDTSDEWIVQRTGIRERHIAADGELTSDLGHRKRRARRSPNAERRRRRRST